jgi:hypothetical protein
MKKIMGSLFVVGLMSCPLVAMQEMGTNLKSGAYQDGDVKVGSIWKVPGVGPIKVLAISGAEQDGFFAKFEKIEKTLRVVTKVKGIQVYAKKIIAKKTVNETQAFGGCTFSNFSPSVQGGFSFDQSNERQDGFRDVEKCRQEPSLIGKRILIDKKEGMFEIVGIDGELGVDVADDDEIYVATHKGQKVVVRKVRKKSQPVVHDGWESFAPELQEKDALSDLKIGEVINTKKKFNWETLSSEDYVWILVAKGPSCPPQLVAKGAELEKTNDKRLVWVLKKRKADLAQPTVRKEVRGLVEFAIAFASQALLKIDKDQSRELAKNGSNLIFGEQKKERKPFLKELKDGVKEFLS